MSSVFILSSSGGRGAIGGAVAEDDGSIPEVACTLRASKHEDETRRKVDCEIERFQRQLTGVDDAWFGAAITAITIILRRRYRMALLPQHINLLG